MDFRTWTISIAASIRGKAKPRGLHAELLEPRVLLSADILGGSYDGGDLNKPIDLSTESESQARFLHDMSALLTRNDTSQSTTTDIPQPLSLETSECLSGSGRGGRRRSPGP